ncbi:MAG: phosphotransferase [Planctomycetota bacterium]|nr:phosphotransferase [Planctomycetota bacterium]
MDNPAEYEAVLKVLDMFGVGKPFSLQPAGGTASPKWAINSDKGRFIVRVRPSEFANIQSVCFDHKALARLTQSGLPVPAPLTRSDGTTWLCKDGKMYEVLHWVDGEPFNESDLDAIAGLGVFLAWFHGAIDEIPPGKEGRLREDHPDLLEPYLVQLRKLASTKELQHKLDLVDREVRYVREHLGEEFFGSLPHCIIHGDVHPGNLRFRGSQVSAVYDFDYLSLQARVRDVADGLMFFAAKRKTFLDPSDIRSLTQPFVLDSERCRILLQGYQQSSPLAEREWQALPLVIRSRWIQMRLRGCRKVLEDKRIEFVLDGFSEVIQWLDRESSTFFEELRRHARPVGKFVHSSRK